MRVWAWAEKRSPAMPGVVGTPPTGAIPCCARSRSENDVPEAGVCEAALFALRVARAASVCSAVGSGASGMRMRVKSAMGCSPRQLLPLPLLTLVISLIVTAVGPTWGSLTVRLVVEPFQLIEVTGPVTVTALLLLLVRAVTVLPNRLDAC